MGICCENSAFSFWSDVFRVRIFTLPLCTPPHTYMEFYLTSSYGLNGNITSATFPLFPFLFLDERADVFTGTHHSKKHTKNIFARITLTYTIANPNKESFYLPEKENTGL